MEVLWNIFSDIIPDGMFLSLKVVIIVLITILLFSANFFLARNKLFVLDNDLELLEEKFDTLTNSIPKMVTIIITDKIEIMNTNLTNLENRLHKIDERMERERNYLYNEVAEIKISLTFLEKNYILHKDNNEKYKDLLDVLKDRILKLEIILEED